MSTTMLGRLADRVAVITGAASGIGRASAEMFAAEGATVVVVDIDKAGCDSTVEAITAAGGQAHAYPADVSSVDALRQLFEWVEGTFGVLHVLFNNAAIAGPLGLDVEESEYDRATGINLKAAFFGTKFALPMLRKASGTASVLYTSSVSGFSGAPTSPVYGLTKGGILALMRSVARIHGPDGIRANAICPGSTLTPLMKVAADPRRQGLTDQQLGEIAGPMTERIPLRRIADPHEIASVARFLASDEASYVTGAVLIADGGLFA
jgi:NAD(P)-dependent dehydrogenase (short-subunit alcohol dehydrogenase family)